MATTDELVAERKAEAERQARHRRIETQARVVGLLNEVEALLTGWVLKEDREKVSELTSPLYDLLDRD